MYSPFELVMRLLLCLLSTLAFRDVHEQDRELARRRTIGEHLEMFLER